MLNTQKLLPIATLLLSAINAEATILTFSSSFGSGGLASYGDRIVSTEQNGASYIEGAGWTPNIELGFTTLNNAGLASIWSSGYASLLGALGHGAFNVPYQIDLVPDAGWSLQLQSFEIATWSSGSYSTDIRIWDDQGSFDTPNLLSFSATLNPQTVYQPMSSALTGSGTVHFYLNNLGSTGLDNIHFTQAPVPEPGTLLLTSLGIAALLLRRKSHISQ